MKKTLIITMIAAIITATAMLSGCGGENKVSTATADTATTTSAITNTATENATEATLSFTDKAIVNEGLKVDENGKITDKNGNEVKADKDGKIEVTNEKGEKIKVSTSDVSKANDNNDRVTAANNNFNSSANKNNNSGSSSNNSSSAQSNGTQANKKPTSKPNNNGGNGGQSSVADPHEGKTYHEAVYKTVNHPAETKVVNHPAETKQIKVVDKEAYTYEEPVYEYKVRTICNGCGADITGNVKSHMFAGCKCNYHAEKIKVQTGTKTVTVPEEYHYETKVVKEAWSETVVVKEAWTEKVLVKEAGWY